MLLIYLPKITPRSKYIFDLVFTHHLGIEFATTTDSTIFESHEQEKINYSGKRTGEEIFIKASSLLFESSIKEVKVTVERSNDTPLLFPNDTSCDAGFDIFAAVFFMVSRYEEYLPHTPDKHGRFRAIDCLAYQHNFLQNPVVNIWIQYFQKILSGKFPALEFKTSVFKSIFTYDIDIAYKFRGRSFFRSLGSIIKDILRFQFKNIFQRVRSLSAKKDPWDVYDDLKEMIKENELTTVFFFLLGDYTRYDKNIIHDSILMTKLINKIASFSEIGIHPSYRSMVMPGKILTEKRRLEKISHKEITKSRQHYLRFNLPGTYNELLKAGIREDYSMGFTGMPGFRAGICTPFYFYDLEKERATGLQIFPVTFMEVTFMEYLNTSPGVALQNILKLIENIKNVSGTFICIWHNNTVSDHGIYKGWKRVHSEIVNKISAC